MAKQVAQAQIELTLVDRVTAGIRRVQASLSRLGARLGFDRIYRASRLAGLSIANVTNSIGDMMKRPGAVGAVLGIGGGIVAGVIGLARSAADPSGELDFLTALSMASKS